MGQTPETVFDHMPCPGCGSTHLIQTSVQSEDVHVDEDGQIEYIDARDFIDVRELICPECDEVIWQAEEEKQDYTLSQLDDGSVILRGNGQNRAISPMELDRLLSTDDPVTIR